MTNKAQKPWTDTHKRESALALLHEAQTLLLDGDEERALDATNEAIAVLADARDHAGCSTEHLRIAAAALGLSASRILRRVRGLAEGRLVRETAYRSGGPHGACHEGPDAREKARAGLCASGYLARVTRICRKTNAMRVR